MCGGTTKKLMALIACATAFCVHTLTAQVLSVYNVDASGFPIMKANYAAYDYSNKPIVGLVPEDFRIQETPEGGSTVNVSPTITVDCVSEVESDASVIIVVDRSGSMDTLVNGRTRWSYTKDAVNTLVAKIGFKGNTRISVLSFASNLELWNEWVDSPQPIADTIRKKNPGGGTNYELCFSAPQINIYDLFAKRPPNIPRYVVFLTDGYPNPDIENPTKFMDTNSARMRSMGIKFYGITILERIAHTTIVGLSKLTGGKSIVTNEDELANIFSNLAVENSTLTKCIMTWRSPFTCEEQARKRTATVSIVNPFKFTETIHYQTPPASVATPALANAELDCGDPDINTSSTAELTITAGLAGITLTNPRITPDGYFKVLNWDTRTTQPNFSPISLAPKEVRKILVQFTQGSDLRTRRALLQFDGTPCPLNCPLVGGLGKIQVVSPNGGETYSTCDSIQIVWKGIAPSLPVDVFYQTPSSPDPILIASGVRGLRYMWSPPVPGSQYKIKVTSTVPPDYQWIKQLGAYGADSVSSVSTNLTGSSTMFTGWVDGPTTIGSKELKTSYGYTDGIVGFLDSNGAVTRVNFLSGTVQTSNEKIIGGVFDSKFNAFVVGISNARTTTFGEYSGTSAGPEDTQIMTVQMFDGNGAFRWSTQSRGVTSGASWIQPTRIGWRTGPRVTTEIVVEGTFSNYAIFGTDPYGTTVTLTTVNSKVDPFTVVYNEAGRVLSVSKNPASGQITWQSRTTSDKIGYEYSASSMSIDTLIKAVGTTYYPLGASDILITKYGAPQPVIDFSDNVFSVVAPTYTLQGSELLFNANSLGTPVYQVRNSAICNTSRVALTVLSARFTGAHAQDYALTSPIVGAVVTPSTCLNVPVTFTPTEAGIRIAVLEVTLSCGISFTIPVRGTSVDPCPVEIKSLVYVPTAESDAYADVTVPCVLKNTGKTPLSGVLSAIADPGITLQNPGAFTLQPNQCLDAVIRIDAIAFGSRSLELSYGLHQGCSQQKTTITAIVVPPYIVIDSLDYGIKRLGTTHTGTITVRNLSNVTRIIERIEFPTANSADISFAALGTPISMPARTNVEIPITFTPSVRGIHTSYINVFVDSVPEPLVGRVLGYGILPALDATGYDFQPVLVGTTSPENGSIVIKNTDTETDLYIQNVAFSIPTPDFTWKGTLPTFPQIIAPQSELAIPVEFFASQPGARTVDVNIEHDAAPGLAPPYSVSVVKVTASAFEAKVIELDMDRILTCSRKTATFTVVNPSAEIPLRVDAIVSSSSASVPFRVLESAPITIAPSESISLTLEFNPEFAGTFTETFEIISGTAVIQTVKVRAVAYTQPLNVALKGAPRTAIDQNYVLPIALYTAPVAPNVQLLPITMLLTFDNEVLSYVGLNNTLSGWTISAQRTQPNVLEILAQPDLNAQLPSTLSTTIVDVVFHTYLTAKPVLGFAVLATSELECLTDATALQSVSLELGCAAQSRVIKIGASSFTFAQPTPNPARSSSTISYSTGISASTSFQIINSVGTVVQQMETGVLPSGEYELTLSASELPNGVYTVQMSCGPFVSSQRLVVFR